MQLQVSSLERFIEPEKETIYQVKTALAQRNRLLATRRLMPTIIKNQVPKKSCVNFQI